MRVFQDDPRNPSMSSETLFKRGSCCRSSCLHCPFGFTVKSNRLEFLSLNNQNNDFLEQLLQQLTIVVDTDLYSLENYKMVALKGFIFGLIRVDHLFVKEMELLPSFRNQGLTKELIESYYFY